MGCNVSNGAQDASDEKRLQRLMSVAGRSGAANASAKIARFEGARGGVKPPPEVAPARV